MGYPFMQKHQEEHSIRELAVLFGVSISASSKGAKQGVSARRSTRDAELLELIRGWCNRSTIGMASRGCGKH
jgi:hypothetical protein